MWWGLGGELIYVSYDYRYLPGREDCFQEIGWVENARVFEGEIC